MRLTTGFLLSLFLAPVSASHVYHGWAQYSPDLSGHVEQADFSAFEVRATRPADIYSGLDRGNSDLYTPPAEGGEYSPAPDIYRGFGGSSDITW